MNQKESPLYLGKRHNIIYKGKIMNDFKKRVIMTELREASIEELEEIFNHIYFNDNFRTVLDKFIKESKEMEEYTERMRDVETIKYKVTGWY